MVKHRADLDFAQIGAIFNDATTKLAGGIDDSNRDSILQDLQKVRTGIETLLQQHPEDFDGVAAIHAQNIADQMNLEIQAIHSIGSDPYAAKYINDVQRDLIDIVQGDDALFALATKDGANGFAAVPDTLVAPKPFQGNAEQTAFMKQFVLDSDALGADAVELVSQGVSPSDPRTLQLISDIQTFVSDANQFTLAQGGLYSARFNNEFALDGVQGTAANALIHGLQTGNTGEVEAAAEVLTTNADDVRGNMLFLEDPPPDLRTGIPDSFESLAQVGAVFNDATAKLIGGVYDGLAGDGNRASILNDLQATQRGLEELIVKNPAQFQDTTVLHAQTIINQLDLEIQAVKDAGTDPLASKFINDIHRDIVDIVQSDEALQAAVTQGEVAGFMPLPDLVRPAAPFQDNAEQWKFLKTFVTTANSLGDQAIAAVDTAAPNDELIQKINAFAQATNDFSVEQGGIYSARFDNELALEGTNGTAAKALIEGLNTHDSGLVMAAAEALAQNAEDVSGNQTRGYGRTFAHNQDLTSHDGPIGHGANAQDLGGNQTHAYSRTFAHNQDPASDDGPIAQGTHAQDVSGNQTHANGNIIAHSYDLASHNDPSEHMFGVHHDSILG